MSAVEVLRALSTIALVAGVVGLVFGAGFAWWALIASGVLFAAELGAKRLEDR